jgi:hypothetical protein
MPKDEKAPQSTETKQQQPQVEEKAIAGSGVLEAAATFGAIGGGVGGFAGAAHVVKHWNDPPANRPRASVPPPASPANEPSKPKGSAGPS